VSVAEGYPAGEAGHRISQAAFNKATILDLSGLELTAVPDSITQLTSLTDLNLHGNRLTAVPDSVWRLRRHVGHERHASAGGAAPSWRRKEKQQPRPVPAPRCARCPAGSKATILDLSGLLTAVPDSVWRLTSLNVLRLGRNQLTAVPASITQLTSLTRIDLTDNQLTAVPDSIGRLTSLTDLNLSENQLTASRTRSG
jgi:Leucine-rich repeat (LRR) protein